MPVNHPRELHGLFTSAFLAKDTDALLALYEPAAVHLDLEGNELSGEQALRGLFDGLLRTIDSFEATSRKVIVAGDLALSSSEWKGTVNAPDGTTQELSGTTAEVSRRQPDGTWLCVIDDATFA